MLPVQAQETPPASASTTAGTPQVAANPLSPDTPTAPAKSSWWDNFRDSQDHDIDMSRWLLQHKGALLVPIIITEPAVGNGGGVAAVFFHPPKQSEESKEKGDHLPPDIYGVAAFKTENGTYAYGLGGSFHFKDDTWRYVGLLGKASFNLDFYTQGLLLEPAKIGYNLDGVFSYQQVSKRLGDTDLFASARWIYMDIDSRLNLPDDYQFFEPRDFAKKASGLGLGLSYDSRDNTLTPSRGWLWRIEGTSYAPAFGSDNTFQTYRSHVYGYFQFWQSWVLGLRADYRAARGDVPFYQLPSIDLRGIAYGRYQDQNVGMLEAELRWNITPRWAVLGFGGAGRAWGRALDFNEADTHWAEGVGFRYLIARALGLYVGVDWAWSEGDHAYYIQVGSAWR
ncbi:BamA/TamA family outer membrane protein [Dyella sp. C9]|uniref:BamA/TamA family outer membrane protein n=1 Tax=Dyella sp. C9 TaxID=2202154 RepID=UPI000DEF9E14|nr:BamA/TamA family outer membrane protein [Dyella sp. C9]